MTPVGVATSTTPCLAIDIGGTKVDIAVVARSGDVIRRERFAVRDHEHDLFDHIVRTARHVMGHDDVRCVGVACAGPMRDAGEEVSPLNITAWRSFPLRRRLRDAFGDDVYVDGDVRALALAEGAFGAATNDTSYASLVVSTGIGGAFVLNGRLVDGASGNAGHIGHLNVVPDGTLCSCGSFGCLEAEASGWAIEARTGRPASEADSSTRERTARLVGRAVGTLAAVLDFDRCYVAGAVALGFGEHFLDVANKHARLLATVAFSRDLEILPSRLGDEGTLLGAAMVGWRGTR